MALIKCPQCGGNVSDKAVKCPHCGCNLGKATIIQHGNRVDAKAMSTAGKIILAVAIFIGSAMCIIPLFTNLYQRGWAPAFGYYLPITYVLVGFGIIAGLLSFGLAVYGIVRLCKNKVSTWKYWLFSTVFAWVSVLVVFKLVVYNEEAYFDLYSNINKNKLEEAKGTYECQLKDGTTISFSIRYDGDGFFECRSSDGTTRIGRCHIYYEFEFDEYCFEVWLPEASYDGANISKSRHAFFMYDEDKLKFMYVDSVKYPLKKISDDAKTKEGYKAQIEQNKQAKLEEFKNFTSNDLSAFMLHGKVKEVVIDCHESIVYSAKSIETIKFDEKGELIEFRYNDGDEDNGLLDIQHEGNMLILQQGTVTFCYVLNQSDKLTMWERRDMKYSSLKFNSNGWPTILHREFIQGDFIDNINVSYSDIDEYGNFRRMIHESEYGKDTYTRTITYYPID